MNDKNNLKKIETFLQTHDLAVLATCREDGLPEAAVIGFSEVENFELIFGTFANSRKYANFQVNPNVAVVIGWDKGITVQYEGRVVELEGDELKECKRVHLAKMPSAAKYVSASQERFFKITPKWIKYSNLSVDPWETFEIRF